MRLVIYRDKETNKIIGYHEANEKCTQENLNSFNSNNKDRYAEFVDLEENSIAYYFYNLKTTSIKQEYENLKDLQDTLYSIAGDIEDRMTRVEKWLDEQKEDNNDR